jgi:hypothetical protein
VTQRQHQRQRHETLERRGLQARWTPPLAPLTPEELPPGDHYVGAYRGYEAATYFDQVKLRLDYELVEPAAVARLVVPLFVNDSRPSRNHRPSRRSKFYQLWVQVNGGPPARGQRMVMQVFDGWWRLRIRWGLVKGEPSTPLVDALVERVAGGPTR